MTYLWWNSGTGILYVNIINVISSQSSSGFVAQSNPALSCKSICMIQPSAKQYTMQFSTLLPLNDISILGDM